jgi:transposase
VAVLGASNYTFAEATHSQKLEDWTGSHIRAFHFFGGVPQLVVPDNLKSAVTQACRYEPILNRTYEEMLRHYNTTALPARPAKPKDKSKAEVGVQVVTRWILARLRKTTFFNLFELQLEVRRLCGELNERPFKRLPGSRRSRFEELDRPSLQPLPATDYEFSEWLRKRVGIDYHIEIERHFYSVPSVFAKREVEVRLTASAVECFAGGKRIAAHVRSRLAGRHSTTAEHMPKAHRAHLEWTPGRFLNWAREIGEATHELVDYLLCNRPHPEMGFRSCLGLLSLNKRYGSARLDAACRRALDNGTPNRRSVVSILRQGLDRLPPPPAEAETPSALLPHENIRGPDYYC